MQLSLTVEPLGKHHDRSSFSCGVPELDDWFRHRAGQDERRNVARVFVAVDRNLGVVGFYTVSAFAIEIGDIPADIARKLPKYSAVPAALIGRLARDNKVRGRGVGEFLVGDAVKRILAVAPSIAVFAIVVEAKGDSALKFYESLGFHQFSSSARRLYLLSATATEALQRL